VLIISYGFSVWGEFKSITGQSPKLQVAVSGEGRVASKPDIARITGTIVTEKEDLKAAQDDNSIKSKAVTDYLKSQGVEDKDIKTVAYNIFPQYSYPPPCFGPVCPLETQRPRIIGYQVRNSLEVTIRDISKAGAILSGVVGAGVNEVGGVSFTIENPEALKAQARGMAIADAEAKARTLAKNLDHRLGKIVSFNEGGSFPMPIFLGREAAVDGKGGGGFEPAIEPGESEIVVIVNVTYEFK